MRLRVAAAQLSSGREKEDNLAAALVAIDEAADAGATLVVLPEATMVSFDTSLLPYAETLDGPFAQSLRSAAESREITVVAGMFEPSGDGRVYNTLLATGRGVEAAYRKIHLYDAFGSRESETVAPGHELVDIEVDGVRVGLATCYDLRFPDHFTELARRGAEVFAVPASWGDGPGKQEQWDLLTRARAADGQAFVVAAGQAWRRESVRGPLGVGRSVVVDPTGTVRARLGGRPELLVTDIDTELVKQTRRSVPIL